VDIGILTNAMDSPIEIPMFAAIRPPPTTLDLSGSASFTAAGLLREHAQSRRNRFSHRGSPRSLRGALHERRPGHSGGPERGLDSRRLRRSCQCAYRRCEDAGV